MASWPIVSGFIYRTRCDLKADTLSSNGY